MEFEGQPVLYAELLEWKTGSVEVAVFIRTCGFKSHVLHHQYRSSINQPREDLDKGKSIP